MRKKLQLFLSLCLVLFTSLGTAKAQSLPAFPHMYYPGEFVTEVTDGMKVVITPCRADRRQHLDAARRFLPASTRNT